MFRRVGTPEAVVKCVVATTVEANNLHLTIVAASGRIVKVIFLDVGRKNRQSVRMNAPEAPFLHHVKRRCLPAEMTPAPTLPAIVDAIPVEPYYALLINPFYLKHPSPTFANHVLTPRL